MTSTMPTDYEFEYNILNAAFLDLQRDANKLLRENKMFAYDKCCAVLRAVGPQINVLKERAMRDGFIPALPKYEEQASINYLEAKYKGSSACSTDA